MQFLFLKFMKSLKHHIYDLKSYPGKRDIFCIHRRWTSFKSKWCWHAKTFWVYSSKVSTKDSYHSTFGFHTFFAISSNLQMFICMQNVQNTHKYSVLLLSNILQIWWHFFMNAVWLITINFLRRNDADYSYVHESILFEYKIFLSQIFLKPSRLVTTNKFSSKLNIAILHFMFWLPSSV